MVQTEGEELRPLSFMLCSQKTSLLEIVVVSMKGKSMAGTSLKTYCVCSEPRLVPDLHNLGCTGCLTFTPVLYYTGA